jgi:hypothetical protein
LPTACSATLGSPSHRRPGRAVTDASVVDRLCAGSGLVVPAASAAAREVGEHAACDLGQRDVDSGGDGGHDGKAREAGAEREQRQRRGSLWMPSLDPCSRGGSGRWGEIWRGEGITGGGGMNGGESGRRCWRGRGLREVEDGAPHRGRQGGRGQRRDGWVVEGSVGMGSRDERGRDERGWGREVGRG